MDLENVPVRYLSGSSKYHRKIPDGKLKLLTSYGRCVASKENIEKGDCQKEFQALKECIKKAVMLDSRHEPVKTCVHELLTVIRDGSLELVEDFLKKHQDEPQYLHQTADGHSQTPLSVASEMKRGDVVNLLLQYGADPNESKEPNGKVPLHYACDHEEWNACIVRQLLEAGARVDQQMTGGQTPLHIASFHGNVEVVSLLLAHYADVNILDSVHENALCKTKSAKVAKMLIDAESDVDCGCGKPVLNAVSNGISDIVYMLIKAGANLKNDPLVWIANRNKHHRIRMLLKLAGLHKNSGVVRMKSSVAKSTTPKVLRLREIGEPIFRGVRLPVSPIKQTGIPLRENPLIALVQNGSLEQVEEFLKEHKDHLLDFLKPIVETERTPLSVACEMKRGDVVSLLLQHGADAVSCTEPSGKTCLHYACEHKEWSAVIVRKLLEAGARVDQQMTNGQTPLHIASFHGNVEVVSLLLAHYADVNKQDSLCENALCKAKCAKVAKLLIDAGSDVDCGCGKPVLNAVSEGNSDVVDLLIKAGSNLNNDPLVWIASRKRFHLIRKLLVKAGASVKSSSVRMKSTKAKNTNPSALRMREMGLKKQVKQDIKLQ